MYANTKSNESIENTLPSWTVILPKRGLRVASGAFVLSVLLCFG